MRKHSRICAICLVSLFALSAHPQESKQKHVYLGTPVKTFTDKEGALTIRNIAGQRDLSHYDDGGHFDCRRYGRDWLNDRAKAEAGISSSLDGARDFIWKHWQEKKRGYLRITLNSVDATSTSHIFIEADGKGSWQVVWRIVREHSLLTHGRVDDAPLIREVERENSALGASYVLVFKSSDGTRQETL